MESDQRVRIEELTSDIDHLAYCRLLRQLTTIDPENITKEVFARTLQDIQSNPLHKIIIAKIDDRIVGSITVLIEQKIIHNLSRVAHIEDVVVDQSVRRLGIGKLLIERALDLSRIHDCYKVILDCSSPAAIAFYEKLGFEQKGQQFAIYYE